MAATGQVHTQGQVINIRVTRGTAVRDGTSETVCGIDIFQAAGLVERVISQEPVVGLADSWILEVVVCAAVGVVTELLGEGAHQRRAGREDDFAGCVEGLDHVGEGFGGLKKRHRILDSLVLHPLQLTGTYLKKKAER